MMVNNVFSACGPSALAITFFTVLQCASTRSVISGGHGVQALDAMVCATEVRYLRCGCAPSACMSGPPPRELVQSKDENRTSTVSEKAPGQWCARAPAVDVGLQLPRM